MCGIAGVLTSAARPTANELLRMAAAIRHRGPDGHGYLLDREFGFAHTRLSLVDLTGGAQPIANEDGTLWLIANGEVFDHVAQRRTLEALGHRFRTHSDVEVLLHAFEQWGSSAWQRLDGQFAAAIWNASERRLVLVRDRFGIVPLQYAITADSLVFASEAKALFAGGRLSAQLDPDALRDAFTFWSAPAPATVFRHVAMLPPGSQATISNELQVQIENWWQPDFSRRPIPNAGSAQPGCYLSGGVDSSLLAAMAAQQVASMTTFGIGFDNANYDESQAQEEVRRALGIQHHSLKCSAEDVREHLPKVIWHCEAPLMRTAPVPLWLLSRSVQQHGIKTVLTGEGADELLGGYSVFLEDRVRRFWARQPDSQMRPALLERVHEFVGDSTVRASSMWRAFYGAGLQETERDGYAHAPRWRNGAWTTRLLQHGFEPDEPALRMARTMRERLPSTFASWTSLAKAEATEVVSFLMPYLLSSQGDRVALAHGVEARYPLLAPEVADYCAGLPDHLQIRGLTTKVVLRDVAQRYLPASVWQRKKQPYRAPIEATLFCSQGDDYVGELLSDRRIGANPLLAANAAKLLRDRARRVQQLSEREAMALCGLLSVQLLDEQYCRNFADYVTGPDALREHADVAIDLSQHTPPYATT
jgi:asparagine synthase (glutamine-hydrolysing)